MTLSRNNPELLGTEPVGRLLKRYALPAIIAMSSSSLYNIIDSIFIGHGVGAMAISGLAIAMPLMNLMAAFGSLVGVGASSLISIRLGQGNKQRAFLILSNAIMLNVVIGLTFTTLGLIFLDDILYFFGASDQTIPYARDFMRIILSGNVITHVFMGMNEILRASGYPKKKRWASCLRPCSSSSASIRSSSSDSAGASVARLFRHHHRTVRGARTRIHALSQPETLPLPQTRYVPFHRHHRTQGALHRHGPVPAQRLRQHRRHLHQQCPQKNGGDISIGAYGIVNRVLMLFVMIVNGLNQGMQPIVGYNYGARQFDRVIRTLKLNIVCAVCVTTFGFILGHFFPHLVAGMFTDDPTLLSVAEMGLKISLLAFPIAGFQIVSSGFFQYIGKPQKAILLSLTRQLLFLVPLLAVLPDLYGTMGVWASMPIADCLAAFLAGVLLFFQIRKMRRHPDEIKVI